MGTRCLTVLHDFDKSEIAVLYRQFDGYPDGHGNDLVTFLKDMKICNGLPVSAESERLADGPECLAAQIVAHFKDGAGRFYLYPAGTRDMGEEYVYHVYPSPDGSIDVVLDDDDGSFSDLLGM